MQDTLEFPEITDSVPTEQRTAVATAAATALDLRKIDLTDVALAQFGDWRGQVAAVRRQLDGVVHDLSTHAKLADAKSLRQRLINAPRADARKVSTDLKSKLAQTSKAIGGELESIVKAWDDAEQLITPQIEAREAEIEAERAEKARQAAEAARLEAERRQRMEDGIATLAGYVGKASGKTAAQIVGGLDFVRGIVIDPEHWKDYAERAAATLEDTIAKLEAMLAAQVKAEAEAAELEALRREKAQREAEDRDIDCINDFANDCVSRGSQYIKDSIREFDEVVSQAVSKAARVQALLPLARARMVAALEEAERREAAALAQQETTPPADAGGAPPAVAAGADAEPIAAGEAENPGQEPEAATGFTEALEPTGEGKAVTPGAGNAEAAPITGNPPGMLQDDSRGLSLALASKPDAMLHAREAAATVKDSLTPAPLASVVLSSPIKLTEARDAARAQLQALAAHCMAAFDCRFPSHPKPPQTWLARLRELAEGVA